MTTLPAGLGIGPIEPEDLRCGFCCGVPKLDAFWRDLASRVEKVPKLPREITRRAPSHISCVLLGRLAVDASERGKSYGRILLVDALNRAIETAENLGCALVVTHAKDAAARSFYEKYDFVDLENDTPSAPFPRAMFLPIATLIAARQAASTSVIPDVSSGRS